MIIKDIVDRECFEQDPEWFMNHLVGTTVIGRVNNNQADRLVDIFDRKYVRDILAKDSWSWEDYQTVRDSCI